MPQLPMVRVNVGHASITEFCENLGNAPTTCGRCERGQCMNYLWLV